MESLFEFEYHSINYTTRSRLPTKKVASITWRSKRGLATKPGCRSSGLVCPAAQQYGVQVLQHHARGATHEEARGELVSVILSCAHCSPGKEHAAEFGDQAEGAQGRILGSEADGEDAEA